MWGGEIDKRYWLLLALSGVVLLEFPAVFIIAPSTQFTYLELAQVVAPAGSLVISIILAFLYLNLGIAQERQTELIAKQTDIQDKQNEILERQVSLNRTQFEPDVEILEASPTSDDFDSGGGDDLYTVRLVNKGKGVANNLNLWCELLYNDVDDFVLIDDIDLEIDGRRFNLRPALNSLVSSNQIESDQIRHYGGYLEPGETAEYQAEIGFLGSERGYQQRLSSSPMFFNFFGRTPLTISMSIYGWCIKIILVRFTTRKLNRPISMFTRLIILRMQ